MTLNGNPDETNGYNSVAKNGEVSNVDFIKSMVSPIGSVTSWLKTFGSADSGTTDGTTANKLVQSGQNFTTTVDVGMIVHNTTDDTFANVTVVDSDTTLTLDSDIMVSGEAYIIYKTPQLPDGWVECDGSVLSDSDSPYDGETIPDLNGGNRFLRGNSTSGGTGGASSTTLANHQHHLDRDTSPVNVGTIPTEANRIASPEGNALMGRMGDMQAGSTNLDNIYNRTGTDGGGSTINTIPKYYNVIFIIRIK